MKYFYAYLNSKVEILICLDFMKSPLNHLLAPTLIFDRLWRPERMNIEVGKGVWTLSLIKVSSGGGWQAIFYVFKIAHKVGWFKLLAALRAKNACKTCALGMGGQLGGMRNEQNRWPEVCKKSVQAMASDMQSRVHADFFETYTVAELARLSSRELENSGRITRPFLLGKGEKKYRSISWERANEIIVKSLQECDPKRMFFYMSGRSSNEAAFLVQLLARQLGSNHVNNCSYYCHQASGVALKQMFGTGTSTLSLEDLEHSDFVMLVGANPASNHPRFMTILKELRKKGSEIIVINPLREIGLLKFKIPSQPWSMLLGSKIATDFLQVKVGGDIALSNGIAKVLLSHGLINHDFVKEATEDFKAYVERLDEVSWDEIVNSSGLERQDIERVARKLGKAKNAVFAWCMGLTHHLHGVGNIQSLANLSLLMGMVGKKNAGLLPIRGHSNIQGIGSMAVTPELKKEVFDRIEKLGIKVPTWSGYDTMACMDASSRGDMDFAFCLGGNLFGSNPESAFAQRAFSKISTVVYCSTTLNTGHMLGLGEQTLILPACARDEEQQATTQESMFNYVRLSDGGPARFDGPRSEVNIVASIAIGVFNRDSMIKWNELFSHKSIRQLIASIIPGYEKLSEIDQSKKEFHISGRLLHSQRFQTSTGKAKFMFHQIPESLPMGRASLNLITLRSEGQFNTVVFEDYDLYRNQKQRDIILMNPKDISRLGLKNNQRVVVKSLVGQMRDIVVRPFDIKVGSAAMYYPEANRLVAKSVDAQSKTPAFKSTWVEILA